MVCFRPETAIRSGIGQRPFTDQKAVIGPTCIVLPQLTLSGHRADDDGRPHHPREGPGGPIWRRRGGLLNLVDCLSNHAAWLHGRSVGIPPLQPARQRQSRRWTLRDESRGSLGGRVGAQANPASDRFHWTSLRRSQKGRQSAAPA